MEAEQKTTYSEQFYLDRLRAGKTPVTVFMVNGFRMRGTIAEHDADTILLTCDGKKQMLYKRAVSTVTPERPAAPNTGFLTRGGTY